MATYTAQARISEPVRLEAAQFLPFQQSPVIAATAEPVEERGLLARTLLPRRLSLKGVFPLERNRSIIAAVSAVVATLKRFSNLFDEPTFRPPKTAYRTREESRPNAKAELRLQAEAALKREDESRMRIGNDSRVRPSISEHATEDLLAMDRAMRFSAGTRRSVVSIVRTDAPAKKVA